MQANKTKATIITKHAKAPKGASQAAMCHTPHGTRHLWKVGNEWVDSNKTKYEVS